MSRERLARFLAERAAIYLFQSDPEFVVGGCSDVSEVIAAWLKKRGYSAEPVYGHARYGKRDWFPHAWLTVEGRRFDPVLWVQACDMEKYRYREDPDVEGMLLCDVEFILEGSVEELDQVITRRLKGEISTARPGRRGPRQG